MIRLLPALLLCLLVGCVERHDQGDAAVFANAWWAGPSAILAGVALLVAAPFLWRWSGKWSIISGLAGLLLGVILAPTLLRDRVSVSPTGYSTRNGMFFSPNDHEVQFANVSLLQIVRKETTGRRGRKNVSYELEARLKSGGSDTAPIGDLMKEGGLVEVVAQAIKAGVRISDPNVVLGLGADIDPAKFQFDDDGPGGEPDEGDPAGRAEPAKANPPPAKAKARP